LHGELDRTIGERLLGDQVAFLASFNSGSFNGVRLEEPVQVDGIAPAAVKRVGLDNATIKLANGRILPTRELDSQASGLVTEEAELAAGGRR
jgi:hypothetical protein